MLRGARATWFDKLTTNGFDKLTTNGFDKLTTNGFDKLTTNGGDRSRREWGCTVRAIRSTWLEAP